MLRLCLAMIIVAAAASALPATPSGVKVTILTDTSKEGLHLGPYDRTRFDLIETYNPLSTAGVAKDSDIAKIKKQFVKANGVKSAAITEDKADLASVGESLETPSPKSDEARVVLGEYLAWSSWSPCINGRRQRTRVCTAKRAARKVRCLGPAKETQVCFTTDEVNTAVAADPWKIEREISGSEMELERPKTQSIKNALKKNRFMRRNRHV